MHIDKYKQSDGTYCATDGCEYLSAEDFIQSEILGFCLCANPKVSLDLVRRALTLIKNHWDNVANADNSYLYQCWKEYEISQGIEFHYYEIWLFIMYYFDSKKLTEHGGSVDGAWLTQKGYDLLEDLDELLPKEFEK